MGGKASKPKEGKKPKAQNAPKPGTPAWLAAYTTQPSAPGARAAFDATSAMNSLDASHALGAQQEAILKALDSAL